jgi:hypothetical protein
MAGLEQPSHGEEALKQGGNLLLLDEPANDLDVETLASLEHALGEFPGCAVITSHDRWFLDRVATTSWPGKAVRTGSGSSIGRRVPRGDRTGRYGQPASRTRPGARCDNVRRRCP